jgi:hypothetical protein
VRHGFCAAAWDKGIAVRHGFCAAAWDKGIAVRHGFCAAASDNVNDMYSVTQKTTAFQVNVNPRLNTSYNNLAAIAKF